MSHKIRPALLTALLLLATACRIEQVKVSLLRTVAEALLRTAGTASAQPVRQPGASFAKCPLTHQQPAAVPAVGSSATRRPCTLRA
jgi:hypothetical protein